MFGLDDWLFIRNVRKRREGRAENNIEIERKIIEGSDKIWFCYIPATVFDSPSLKKKALPKKDSYIAYRLSRRLVSLDTNETIKLFDEVYNHSVKEIKKLAKEILKNISVLGISFGSSPACLVANNFKVEKLILVVPGADLPYCMTHSSYTKRLFGKEAIENAEKEEEKAEKIFHNLNPINNLENAPDNAIIHLSLWDRIMPYKDAIKIAKKLKELGKKPIVHKSFFFGHSLTIATFNNKG